MKKQSQMSELLKHFKKGIWISQVKAFDLVGTTRLSAKIFDLKKLGHTFTTRVKSGKNRYGNDFRVTEYRLNK